MLAGEYGEWFDGRKSTYVVAQDEIESRPVLAKGTRYGISLSETSPLSGAGWSMTGGLVSRVGGPEADIELFGKEITRGHGMKGYVTHDDYSYEFFLVVRPRAGPGRLVRQWSFAREELALGRTTSGLSMFFVEGTLTVDKQTNTAIVTIRGLVRPFQERVDLSFAPR